MLDFSDLEATIKIISSSIESQDRQKRKKVIDTLSDYVSENKEYLSLFESVRHIIWSCVSDQSEIVRDSALNFLQEVIKKSFFVKYVDELMPVLLHRFQAEEPSEEIRLKRIQLLGNILDNYKVDGYCLEIIECLVGCLEDKYPAVRQEAAKCCVRVSAMNNPIFYENCVKFIKPLVLCFKHKHSKTRILAIEALAAVMKEANWKNVNAQLVFGSLGETLFDDHQGVRLAVVELLGIWLIQLRDRYSFFSRLVPLILSCLVDEHPDVRLRAWQVWNEAGMQFLNENEADLKDKLDFLDGDIDHYPDGVERPNLGCRTLVKRNLIQISTPLIKELTDWQSAVRVKASALLSLLVLHAEAELTQHTETILQALYSLADSKSDDAPQFRENIDKTAEFIGHFVKPSTWHLLIFPILETEPTSGKFFVLAGLLRGTKKGQMEPYAENLSRILSSSDACTTIQPKMQLEILKSCRAFLDNVSQLPETSIEKLVYCIAYISAVSCCCGETKLLAKAGAECIIRLGKIADKTTRELYQKCMKSLLDAAGKNVNGWSITHPDCCLLIFILSNTEKAWIDYEDKIMEILKTALAAESNAEVKSLLYTTLTFVLDKECNAQFLTNTVHKLIMPGLIWRAGMTAERLRTCVLLCLKTVLEEVELDISFEKLLPLLFGCVRDEPNLSRLLTQQCIAIVVDVINLTPELVNDIFPKVAERLDDVDNQVRVQAITTLNKLLAKLPIQMTENTHNAVFSYFVKTLLPYLDDDCESTRQNVFEALLLLGNRAPSVLQTSLKSKAHLFKSQELCNRLLESDGLE